MNKSYGAGGARAGRLEDGPVGMCTMIVPHLASVLAVAPATISWSPKVALVMIVANVIAIAIGKATIQKPNEGLQLPSANFFGGLSHGAMLGTMSLGHILGIGAIQGLASRGVL
jgi:photosystem I subunit 10